MTPHDPRSTHQKYIDMYDTASIMLPTNFLPEHHFNNGELNIRDEKTASFPRPPHETKEHIRDYYALITHNDEKLGEIITALKESDLYDNSIIIYLGDNSLCVGQHGLMGKQNLYESSINVPLIIVGKGISKNAKTDAMVYLTDIYPTLCDMLGIKIPESVEGKSFMPVIEKGEGSHRNYIVTTYRHLQRAIRNDHCKLIKYNVNGEKHAQLFNLFDDPNEMVNLYDSSAYLNVNKELNAQLELFLIELNDTIWKQ
jgi:arylsulfatase A-like enzyme